MFEKFGFKDACIGLWKYKFIILIVALLTAIGVYDKYVCSNNRMIGSDDGQYVTTSTLYVSPNIVNASQDVKALSSQIEASNILASSYLSILKSEVCKDYVFKRLKKDYSAEEIITYFKATSYTKETLDKKVLDKLVKVSNSENSLLLINIVVQTYNERFSYAVVDAYNSFVETKLASDASNIAKITPLDSTQQITRVSIVNIFSTFFLKRLIVVEFLAVALTIVLIFIKLLFMPTINNKGDFRLYNVPVIAELKGFSNIRREKQ